MMEHKEEVIRPNKLLMSNIYNGNEKKVGRIFFCFYLQKPFYIKGNSNTCTSNGRLEKDKKLKSKTNVEMNEACRSLQLSLPASETSSQSFSSTEE